MGELTIGVFSSLVGSTTLASAVKIAEAAMEKGHKVNFWTSGNATALAKKGQKKFQDYNFLQDKILELIEKGMEFTICEACAQARGMLKEDSHEQMKRAAMDWYLAKGFGSDRMLHIGGE
jgi:tRNA 2-thiouridine synthesizing protein D